MIEDIINDKNVYITKDTFVYNQTPPFHPSESYPENISLPICNIDNPAYRSIRNLFITAKFDENHIGQNNWNPLKHLVNKDDTILIKPNFVNHQNLNKEKLKYPLDCLVTHGSVIRAIMDYCARALNISGKIIIGDAPIQGARWDIIIKNGGLNEIVNLYKHYFPKIEIKITDFRLVISHIHNGKQIERTRSDNKIDDYTEIDINENSLLLPLMDSKYKFGVAQYSYKKLKYAHNTENNKYIFPNTALNADLVINLPKLKFHKRAGITCALKNLVGLIGHKDYLPHFRCGSPKNGGDEYPDGNRFWDFRWYLEHLEWEFDKGNIKKVLNILIHYYRSFMIRILKYPTDFDHVGSGGWYGNDTLLRTVIDINKAFFYKYKFAKISRKNQKYITITDGIIGGDKNSPLVPSEVKSGIMMLSKNPCANDIVAAHLMRFDHSKILQLKNVFYKYNEVNKL